MRKRIGILTASLLSVFAMGCGASAASDNNTTTAQEGSVLPTVSYEYMTQAANPDEPAVPIDPGADIAIDPTEAVSDQPDYNSNLYSTWGRLYSDGQKAYFVDLSADEKTQIIYSIENAADAKPQKIYEYPSLMQDNIGYISCSFMAGFEDTIVYVDANRMEGCEVRYISKDGKESGVIGRLQGHIDYAGHSQDEEKVFYKTYTYAEADEEEAERIVRYYEVDIKNRTMKEFQPDIEQKEGTKIYILGITKSRIVYVALDDELSLYILDRSTLASSKTGTLPRNIDAFFLAGDYLIFSDADDIVYSTNITDGVTYEICRDCEIDFDDGCIHVVNDKVYYLKDEKDLYFCTIHGEDTKLIAKETDRGYKYMLGSFGDWVFFKYNRSSEEYFYRIGTKENAFPGDALVDSIR